MYNKKTDFCKKTKTDRKYINKYPGKIYQHQKNNNSIIFDKVNFKLNNTKKEILSISRRVEKNKMKYNQNQSLCINFFTNNSITFLFK